jgi:hypothetical protein
MDVASPLIEYVNSGRMMSLDEISEIIQVVRSADKYKADADRLAEALEEIASFRYTTLCVGGDDRINKLRDIASAALAAHEEGKNG